MKLTDKAKKCLTVTGLGLVCIALAILIASWFEPEVSKEVSIHPSNMVSGEENLADIIPSPSTVENVPLIKTTDTSTPPASAGDFSGTEQSIQAEVTKPTEPPREVLTDPSKTPDGKEVDKVTPVKHEKVKKPESTPSKDTNKAGEKNEKGQIWFPGFGWVDDEGANTGTQVGNDGDKLTGNKVGSMY